MKVELMLKNFVLPLMRPQADKITTAERVQVEQSGRHQDPEKTEKNVSHWPLKAMKTGGGTRGAWALEEQGLTGNPGTGVQHPGQEK